MVSVVKDGARARTWLASVLRRPVRICALTGPSRPCHFCDFCACTTEATCQPEELLQADVGRRCCPAAAPAHLDYAVLGIESVLQQQARHLAPSLRTAFIRELMS